MLSFHKTIRDIKKQERESLRQAELDRIRQRRFDLLSDSDEEMDKSPNIKTTFESAKQDSQTSKTVNQKLRLAQHFAVKNEKQEEVKPVIKPVRNLRALNNSVVVEKKPLMPEVKPKL